MGQILRSVSGVVAHVILARRVVLNLVAAATCMTTAWSGAQAADNTRYVSVTGKNTNPCTLAQPCRSLQKAIGIAPSGGEVRVLDSGFYGNNARINKSLTISGNGHTVYLGNPIFVTDGAMAVALRGLVLNGHETSTTNTMGYQHRKQHHRHGSAHRALRDSWLLLRRHCGDRPRAQGLSDRQRRAR